MIDDSGGHTNRACRQRTMVSWLVTTRVWAKSLHWSRHNYSISDQQDSSYRESCDEKQGHEEGK